MSRKRRRSRGSIEELPSGSLRVSVYAGTDPLTGKPHYLKGTVKPGPNCSREAEKLRTSFLAQVDERRNPRTNATVAQLIDRWLPVHQIDATTKRGYVGKIDKHIKPVLGKIALAKLEVETLEAYYASLAKCRDHCKGSKYVQHRTSKKHICDEHRSGSCSPLDPNCRHCKRMCKQHACVGLGDSSVRMIHSILSGALGAAVRWKWISVNPADNTRQPGVPQADPQPPSAEEIALLINKAYKNDPEWGRFLWTKATTGTRRGEMCALRKSRLEQARKVLAVRKSIYKDDTGQLREKDTKTHQQRRLVLDDESLSVVEEQLEFVETRAKSLGIQLVADPYIWSSSPDSSTPLRPDGVSQRFDRLAGSLGIETSIKNLRAYSATELIAANVDLRTVAGRLGDGSGGAMTLRAYAAWSSEADQRAATTLSGRMPVRPGKPATQALTAQADDPLTEPEPEPTGPYQRIARDLQGAIVAGILRPGDVLPTEKALAARYGVVQTTAHRAIAALGQSRPGRDCPRSAHPRGRVSLHV